MVPQRVYAKNAFMPIPGAWQKGTFARMAVRKQPTAAPMQVAIRTELKSILADLRMEGLTKMMYAMAMNEVMPARTSVLTSVLCSLSLNRRSSMGEFSP